MCWFIKRPSFMKFAPSAELVKLDNCRQTILSRCTLLNRLAHFIIIYGAGWRYIKRSLLAQIRDAWIFEVFLSFAEEIRPNFDLNGRNVDTKFCLYRSNNVAMKKVLSPEASSLPTNKMTTLFLFDYSFFSTDYQTLQPI